MKFFGLEIRMAGKKSSPAPTYPNNWVGALNYSHRMSIGELLENPTVNSCVNIISDAVAVLPLNIYRKVTDRGKDQPVLRELLEVLKLGIEIDAEKRENILGGFSTSAPVADVAQKSGF